jgi:hypothetical protein
VQIQWKSSGSLKGGASAPLSAHRLPLRIVFQREMDGNNGGPTNSPTVQVSLERWTLIYGHGHNLIESIKNSNIFFL